MINRLNAKTVSFTFATVFGILYIACTLFFLVTPQIALNFFQYMFHGIDITQIATEEISFQNILIGFLEIILFALVTGWLFVRIYNYFIIKEDQYVRR